MTSILFLLFLLGLSFFFSGTETAFTSLSSAFVYEQAKRGNKRAKILEKLKKSSTLVIGTLLLGNNIVNIAITAITTGLLITALGEYYGVLVSTFGVSFILLIFAEILPKTYALQNTKNFSLKTGPTLMFFTHIFRPFVKALDVVVKFLMRVFHMRTDSHINEAEIKTELRGTLNMYQKTDIMTQERHMLKSVLDLSEVLVEDIMLHRSQIVSLNKDLPLPEIIDFVMHCPFSRIPLWENKRDNVIGILHVKALLKAMKAHYTPSGKNIVIDDYLSKPWFILNTTSLMEQLHNFKKRREHFALVVDEYGVLQGLVTLEDILEEIVGDIADESDTPEQTGLHITQTPTGAYRVSGDTTIRDLNRHFKWDLSDADAATLAGFLMYKIERIPQEGQSFAIDGYTFSIVEKQGNCLKLIDIIPPAL